MCIHIIYSLYVYDMYIYIYTPHIQHAACSLTWPCSAWRFYESPEKQTQKRYEGQVQVQRLAFLGNPSLSRVVVWTHMIGIFEAANLGEMAQKLWRTYFSNCVGSHQVVFFVRSCSCWCRSCKWDSFFFQIEKTTFCLFDDLLSL